MYRFDALLGNGGAEPHLRDLDGDRRPELVSVDDRFSELTGFAGVVRPIQIWSYTRGTFSDVTRSYPKAIERDAAALWRLYLAHRGKDSVRYIFAAWVADQYLLGRSGAVERALADALARGELKRRYESEDAESYLRMVRRFLRRTGYIRNDHGPGAVQRQAREER